MSLRIELVNSVEKYIENPASHDYGDFEKIYGLFMYLRNKYNLNNSWKHYITMLDMDDSLEISCELVKHAIDNYDPADEVIFKKKYRLAKFTKLSSFLKYLQENYDDIFTNVGYYRFVIGY